MAIVPIWIRVPRPGEACPHTGLARSTMLSLVLPCVANGFAPPVRSKLLLSRPNAKRGTRLVDFDDLCRYIRAQPAIRTPSRIQSAA